MTVKAGRGGLLRAALRLGISASPASLCGLIVLALIAAGVPVAAAWLTKGLMDGLASAGASWPALMSGAIGLAVTGLVAAVLPYLTTALESEFSRGSGLSAQDELYRRVNDFDGLGRFEEPAFLDRLRMAQDAGQQAPGQLVLESLSLAQAGVMAVGFLASLLAISPAMAWIVFLAAVPAMVGELRLARQRTDAAYHVNAMERRELFYAFLLADVQAAKETRLFGIGGHLRRLMRAERTAINVVQRRLDVRTTATHGGLTAVSAAVAAGGLLWAIWSTTHGRLGLGDLTLFVAAVAAVQGSLSGIAFGIAMCRQQLLLFGHYRAVLTAGPDLVPVGPPADLPPLRDAIVLRDIWFRYSPEHPWILRGVNLTIPCGRSVALVGANGAGKSTVVKLLCRFYDPECGSIRWDGVDIRSVPVDQLRQRLSAIFQDFMEYDMPAGTNIALGDLSRAAEPGAIADAAARAGIHETLQRLPHGYDTMLSRMYVGDPGDPQDGVVLSGGQWQRVALARAMLRDHRDLMIMDEPSSGLDAEAEYEIHTKLRDHRTGRTSLLISHRLGAVRSADTIAVLEGGVVVAQGRHDELVRDGGLYARLFRLQATGYQESVA